MNTFTTRHQGLAALLRYAKGDAAHLRTFQEGTRNMSFEFADDGSCAEIARMFFGDDGQGAAVADARALLDCHRAIRKSLSDAINNGGEWRSE